MSTRFRWAGTTTRLVAGTAVAVAVAAAIATGVSVSWPSHDREAVALDAVPAPSDTVLSCAGPLLALGRDAAAASGLTVAAPQRTVAGTPAGSPDASAATLSVPGLGDGEGPAAYTASPEGSDRTELAAAGSATVNAADLAGFAASACAPPLMDSWLVGGASSTGASDLVLLSNPGAVPATVDLTVYGVDGAQTPPTGNGLIIAPGTQRVIPLAALILGEEGPVVHVTAAGAPVQASLQASLTRTLLPGGVDQLGAIAAPATTQVIPGVPVTSPPGAVGASDATTLVRLLSPSSDTTATITTTAVGGGIGLEPQTVPLAAGVPVEVELAGLAVGTYTVKVEAGAPVLASGWETTGFGQGADFAWYTSAPAVDVDTLFAVAEGEAPALVLVNDGAEPVTARLSPANGEEVLVQVPARGSVRTLVQSGAVYTLRTDGDPVHASVVYAGVSALAGYPVWPADAATAALVVYP